MWGQLTEAVSTDSASLTLSCLYLRLGFVPTSSSHAPFLPILEEEQSSADIFHKNTREDELKQGAVRVLFCGSLFSV